MNDVKSLKESLRMIEFLCYLSADPANDTSEQKQKLIDTIYEIAHLHSGCKNKHIEWRKNRQKLKKEFKKCGWI